MPEQALQVTGSGTGGRGDQAEKRERSQVAKVLRLDAKFRLGLRQHVVELWPSGSVVAWTLSLGWLRIAWGEVNK